MGKTQRETLRLMFDGRCAYCGCVLGDKWHADHVEPVLRQLKHVPGKGFVCTGKMFRPENHRTDNLVPACIPCNIDKATFTVDQWRNKLETTCDVLGRNNATYKHGVRFGVIVEARKPITFHFERASELGAKVGGVNP